MPGNDDDNNSPAPKHNPFSMFGLTLSRFRESFGEANLSSPHDHQWSVKTSPFGSDVYVLLTGSQNQPFVWVIDPNDRNDGVSRSIVDHEDAIVEIIEHVRERIKKGSRVQRRVKETFD